MPENATPRCRPTSIPIPESHAFFSEIRSFKIKTVPTTFSLPMNTGVFVRRIQDWLRKKRIRFRLFPRHVCPLNL
ncbi:hypothetical protein RB7756 [Rhodopirellula baltica SH 1]|uniref:Uncharacterized protein n=1 Tax=Rhodopirellula baltica (strain DSM 10527 / NCIMB 13988 / SH1) TaxID=243090 RepID=Q7UN61_RHOBA|nr:hypothetical protein RB7756 [Rhodopirellula baltica SH 1]